MTRLPSYLASVALAIAPAIPASGAPYWRQGPVAPGGLTARNAVVMAFDGARGRVVLFGGLAGAAYKNDTWEYDGSAWAAGPAAPGAMAGRCAHAMAYDAGQARIVLFGGLAASGFKNDTWEYNGAAWTQGPAAPAALVARASHGMAYHALIGKTVLFGGVTAGGGGNETWEYTVGTGWAQGPVPPAGLTNRSNQGMAYDPARGVIVLFGGFDGAYKNDTWQFDGASWTPGPSAPAGLTARNTLGMAYDLLQGRTILFGGHDGTWKNDTWSFDGISWSAGAPAPAGLVPRRGLAMATGPAGGVVVFGGAAATGALNDTWDYLGRIVDHVVGEGLGFPNPNRVRVFTAAGTATATDFYAYAAGQFGTNVASGAIDASIPYEILTGPGPGAVYGPQVRGWQRDGTAVGKVNFYAYGTLKYGVNVASGDLDRDGHDEILTGPGPGTPFGPHVRGWNYDGASVSAISKISFFAYPATQYGCNVTAGNVDGDGYAEIVTGQGPGPSFAPEVRGFNYDNAAIAGIPSIDFNAFTTIQYGGFVDLGNVDGDAYDEILCAPGPGPALAARFLGFNFDNASISALAGFDVTPFATHYGGRAGEGELTGDTGDDLVAGAGPDPPPPPRSSPSRTTGPC
ncbi:MAG: hypothetical protein U0166_09790 [Acidobacteriota bacterium]